MGFLAWVLGGLGFRAQGLGLLISRVSGLVPGFRAVEGFRVQVSLMVKGVGFIQGFLFRNLGLIQGVPVKEPPDSGRHVPYCLFVFYLN